MDEKGWDFLISAVLTPFHLGYSRFSRVQEIRKHAMRLMTAHRILIGTATVFFVIYGAWEASGVASGRGSVLYAVLSGLGAAGLALYFRTLFRPET